MDEVFRRLIDTSATPGSLHAFADMVLERGRWAAEVFQRYDRAATQAIVEAVARAAHERAGHYAEWAVRETGFGVVEHKRIKNEQTAIPFVDYYRDWDFVNPRVDQDRKIIELPRPAGMIFALIPSTNPIATINFKTLSALMTRNAIVLSPHPAARECSVDAARHLAAIADAAGAPEGVIQVVEQPSIPLIEQFMKSDKTDVILATGGTAMVRSAYSSSNPAIGVGPGNAPVYVDPSADLQRAAEHIVASKSFDNSVLCTNESVLITQDSCARDLERELARSGAHVLSEAETAALRTYLFQAQEFNVEALGRDAAWIASEVGIRVSPKTRVLVAPIARIGVEEPLSREKLCPVLAMYVAPSREQALAMARAVLRFSGAGHSAAIHADDPQVVMEYAATVECYRVVVNAPCSQGAAGIGTNLAPTYTIGTGYFGRSSIGDNVGPQHLVHWTRVAYHKEASGIGARLGDVRMSFPGPLPEAPSDGVPGKSAAATGAIDRRTATLAADPANARLREEIRRIIAEELRTVLRD